MGVLIRLICFVSLLCFATGVAVAKQWRGIEPYHSTRVDVERVLGLPNFNGWLYDFPEERAHISYSSGSCNVPKDVVVEISTALAKIKPLKEVLIAGKEYERMFASDTPIVYYLDPVEGVEYTVMEGMVQSITYLAARKDRMLECGGHKYAVPVAEGVQLKSIEHYPFDSFGDISFENIKGRLDTFVIQLLNLQAHDSRWRGYVIVYAGRRAVNGEATFMANCARDYLVRVRGLAPESLNAVDGGFREEKTVELFLGRSDFYPPILKPTFTLAKVRIINRSLKSCTDLGP
jgi:hypothetical protein